MKGTLWLAALLVLAAAAEEPQPDDRAKRETAVRQALDAFWPAFLRGDATRLRERVDLPLLLLEPGADGGRRLVITAAGWTAFRQGLPTVPLTEDEVTAQVANLRLEWLDDQTCFAVYDLQAVVKRQGVQGHFLTVFGWADGWKVTVSSIPG